MATEIKLYKSPWKALKLLALTLPFVCIGIWLITRADPGPGDRFWGWVSTCFFGLGLPIGLFHLFDHRPQIIINETGIWDRTTKQDVIPWDLIYDAYTLDIYKQKFICLVLSQDFNTKSKLYKWAEEMNEAIGAQKVNLSLGQVKVDAEKLAEFINSISKDGADRKALLEQGLTGA